MLIDFQRFLKINRILIFDYIKRKRCKKYFLVKKIFILAQ